MAKSELHFLGHILDLLTVETNYNKKFNQFKGTPILYNEGGLLKLVFDFEANFRFLERMKTVNYDLYKRGYPIDDGKIVFYDANGDNLKDWYFKDAPIVYYQFKFDANGGGMRVEMIISPAIQNYGCKIHRSWHITPIEEESYQSPVQATEKNENFNLSIQHLTDKKTLVPLGIPAFNKSPENQNIEFEIAITENGIDDFQVEFLHDNKIIQSYYSGEQTLDEVVVTAKGSGNPSNSTTNSQNTQNNYPKGKYHVKWDGFDKNGIYDSTIFTTGKLKARIKGKRNGIEKTAESSEFSFEYNEVTWVDTKINKNTKRMDVTLRVNLTDGGERGTEKDIYDTGSGSYAPITTHYPWDKIPEKEIKKHGKLPIKTRNKNNDFKALKNLALEGIEKYWGRNSTNIGKGIYINEELYEVFLSCKHNLNGMIAPEIIYFTNLENGTFNRSHNWFGSRQLFYKEGYLKDNEWEYQIPSKAIKEFKETAAHEIGHQLLDQLKGKYHSYTHKGTSHPSVIIQSPVKGTRYPTGGKEIDLMKYADDFRPYDYFKRRVLSEKDLLGLIWLTKLKLN
ncbi:hypothetical protein CXF68_18510 [Tenacibaculum sp. Bg11-29]|uniref:type VI secretion system tube protein TssD n=1 Tax=Tenacibaculum sp. Bg11-29 TaxID=2058306 RepID=UPI000C33895F|nr:type VI secretion system tube protein TssD [Tenacibaculum sp. Bg11-29]PKH52570.1 hypothetical protein CXF68_18510 [Tenacibaculum sp. Bg11-29]